MSKEFQSAIDALKYATSPLDSIRCNIEALESRNKELVSMILKMAEHINPSWETNKELVSLLENGEVPFLVAAEGQPVRIAIRHGKGFEKAETLVEFLKKIQSEWQQNQEEDSRLDKAPQPEKPLHEIDAEMSWSLKKGVSYQLKIGNESTDRELSDDTKKRLMACWNACKGIPKNSIPEEPFTKMILRLSVESIKAKNDLHSLAEAFVQVLAQWKRQKELFQVLEKDGWMDAALWSIEAMINNIGLGGLLESEKKPFYFSLGQRQQHTVIDINKIQDKWTPRKLLLIYAKDSGAAVALIRMRFLDEWSMVYDAEDLPGILDSFPDGIIAASMDWL